MEYVKKKRKQARHNYNRQTRQEEKGINIRVYPGYWNQVEHDYTEEFAGLCRQYMEKIENY